MLNDSIIKKIAELKKQYPHLRSALMPALHLIQKDVGYLSEEVLSDVAKEFCLSLLEVKSVVSFYTMYKTKPVGKYHIRVCRSLSCDLAGSSLIKDWLVENLNVGQNVVTADGLWSYEFVHCLGGCGNAPVIQINDCLYEKMSVEKLEALKKEIESTLPNLSLNID